LRDREVATFATNRTHSLCTKQDATPSASVNAPAKSTATTINHHNCRITGAFSDRGRVNIPSTLAD
jgi:hypothetical protein